MKTTHARLAISTMHLAKGLEFRAAEVMACDDEITPLQERIEAAADDADLDEVHKTERHLLYARWTCWIHPARRYVPTARVFFAESWPSG
jgi:hypothetical protein